MLAVCVSAQAQIKFAIGEPADGSTRSGIGQISGWAVSDSQIVSVEAFIDGVSVGFVPYGGTRLDVAEAFPDYPDSDLSGWSMKWNYALLDEGEHEIVVIVTDFEGNEASQIHSFSTTGFNSEFIENPEDVDLTGASISIPEPGIIVVLGAVIEGETVDIELRWDTAAQQFQIDKVFRAENEGEKENQAPRASAGGRLEVETGSTVTLEGGGVDADGSVVSYAWKQVTGTAVDLYGANLRVAGFTAPVTPGALRFRLTVVDDKGASDDDDVVVEVIDSSPEPQPEPEPEPEPDDNTTGEISKSLLSAINDVRTQPQTCNGTEFPAAPALKWDSDLASIAMQHSMDMASKGYLSHTSPDGTSMGSRVFPHWSGTRVGENIAASSVNRSDSHVVRMWLTSTSGHCELLMNPDFTHAGAGAGQNTRNNYTYHYFWTLDLGG
jgi:uncharacterized protein YkwD